jgi:hypothetical protein
VTILEATIAAALTAAALTAAAQFAVASARAARSAEERQLAADEASNVLERLFVRSWEELTREAAGKEGLSDAAQSRLHEGRIEVAIADEPPDESADGPALQMKRITVSVHWRNAAGEWVAPARLAAFKSRLAEASP